VRLTVVGCSGSFPGPDSPASCYLVEAPYEGRAFRLVLDLGNGAFGHLQRYLDPLQVDAVAFTHLHADHCLDLASMYVYRTYHPDAPHPRVEVYGPATTAARMARAYDMPEQPGMTSTFDFRTWLVGPPVQVGPFELQVARVAHPVETYAIRVSNDGRVLAYSGDTGPCEQLVSLAADADALLAEASFLESGSNPPDLHLTGRVGRLLLTHIPPWHDRAAVLAEAEPAFPGAVELVTSGSTYDI
jgi:ribonuclease BN (tRNA processing enzyme)